MSTHRAPVVRATPTGWLAVSADGDEPRIATVGGTPELAVESFDAAQAKWQAVHELPEPSHAG